MNKTILDNLLSDHAFECQIKPTTIQPDEIVHVAGAQEPVRDQPDARTRSLLEAGWLQVDMVQVKLPETERSARVTRLQQTARSWLRQAAPDANQADRQQVRWLVEKTRLHESQLQITQRLWLALVLYSLDYRGLTFDQEGQIQWDSGIAGRIGIAPDTVLQLAWAQPDHQAFTASFRQPDGTITRGKGRRRWHVYRLRIAEEAAFLFELAGEPVQESVALIVASEIHATQPQLPRDFYGGDAFQQACIDAQDQAFDHILVLSPQHGVISLDDVVPSEQPWDSVLDKRLWDWRMEAERKLGGYLFGKPKTITVDLDWWAWLNPESTYTVTVFGGGFAVQILLEELVQTSILAMKQTPKIVLKEQRAGYDAGDLDDPFNLFNFDLDEDDEFAGDPELEMALQDIDMLLEWSTELVDLISVYVAPINETWRLAPDEALVLVRILTEADMDIEELLSLLVDITLLLEQPLPVSMIINSAMIVSALLQITHSLVHEDTSRIQEMLKDYPEEILRQYIERALQDPDKEERLCACLTLAEQLQILSLALPPDLANQLLVWMQTYISVQMRHRIMGDNQ